jgi:peptidyl-prolyl cis-trans isomerase SurA
MRRLSFHDYFRGSLLLFSVLLVSYPLNAAAKVVDRIVAVVNDDIILLSELDATFKPFQEKIKTGGYPPEKEQQMLYRVREDLIHKMVEKKLTEQEVKARNISVSENEIDQMIERIKQINYLSDEDLKKELEARGVTLKDYRKELKEQSLRNKLVVREVNSKIVITKSDIKKYYDEHPELYGGKTQYHLRNIFLKYPSNTNNDPEPALKERFEPVMEKLKSGAAFEEVARQYSESSSASDGGDLGKFSLDSLSGQIKNNVETLSAGEYTPILRSEQGGQIIFVEEIVQDGGKSLQVVSAEIEQKLYKMIIEKRFDEWMEGLRARSHIKIIR